jgi:hypothetical protein
LVVSTIVFKANYSGSGEPNEIEVESVQEALADAYYVAHSRSLDALVNLSVDNRVIYDKTALARAVERINGLVDEVHMSFNDAIARVAKEDGH